MLHPSYTELMETINEEIKRNGDEAIKSRYSIVIATAKRARQIIQGDEALVNVQGKKPLSVAVNEMKDGKLNLFRVDE
ncbi:DNA-directed RNA polymerase subunit omega [Vallitalea okinawensis]|uniref:DNA-directed RNA polymerase subunit omega n=1 Tax=Vallitalea okinawensis TaxID=2078660 RepID=UPI000CFB37E5|nr:DNA-directed RNA polymerase subunit omega [Vallitalea okinawensis]